MEIYSDLAKQEVFTEDCDMIGSLWICLQSRKGL